MKTILAQSYYADILQMKAALQSKTIPYNFTTYSSYFKDSACEDLPLLLNVSQNLCALKDSFPIYGKMFIYPAFCNEILQMAKQCVLYGIPSEELPCSTVSEKELQAIVEVALELPLPSPVSPDTVDDVLLTPYFPSDSYHFQLYAQLQKSFPYYEKDSTPVHTDFHHALNPRKEIESIAQEICSHTEDTTIVLCDPSSQLPVLQSVFARYHIPYTCVKQDVLPKMYRLFTALLKASVYENSDTLYAAITQNAFPVQLDSDCFEQLGSLLTSTTAPESIVPYIQDIESLASYTKLYTVLDAKLKQYFDRIQLCLEQLYATVPYREKVSVVFDILRKHPYCAEKNHLMQMISLRRQLQNALPFIHTKEDLIFLCAYLDTITASSFVLSTDKVIITDLQHPVPSSTHRYVVGCTSTIYPGFQTASGLFDEQYLAKIRHYPSLSQRYAEYTDSLSWISKGTSVLHYSCYTNDYEGREIQPAAIMHSDTLWPLERVRPFLQTNHSISSTTAESLYIDNNTITGSISTIERWFQCPYSWFLQSGLKLSPKEYPDLDTKLTGTLQHAVLEQAVNTLGKEYASISEEEVEALISPSFDALIHCHPENTILYTLSKKRMLRGLMKALSFLCDFEKHTSYVPYATEQHFLHPISTHVQLKGIIDRMDIHAQDCVRVIDYKSSPHSITQSKLEQGTCLQLLSYLTIAEELTHLTPAGGYYYSLKEETLEIEAVKKTGRGKKAEVSYIDPEEEILQSEKQKKQRLSGWTFTERLTELDDDEKHINHGSHKNYPDFDSVKEILKEVYEFFFVNVSTGCIEVHPTEGACTFCNYKSICRYHGEMYPAKSIAQRKEDN